MPPPPSFLAQFIYPFSLKNLGSTVVLHSFRLVKKNTQKIHKWNFSKLYLKYRSKNVAPPPALGSDSPHLAKCPVASLVKKNRFMYALPQNSNIAKIPHFQKVANNFN
jgi:hypothetical protein